MAGLSITRPISALGQLTSSFVNGVGELTLFATGMFKRLRGGMPRRHVLIPILHEIGVRSVPVILVTGAFIGMVLAVQTYQQFKLMLKMQRDLILNMLAKMVKKTFH